MLNLLSRPLRPCLPALRSNNARSAKVHDLQRTRAFHSCRIRKASASVLASLPPSTPMASTTDTHGNFDLVRQVKLDYTDLTVSKWKSRVTGLTVVHMDYEALILNGYFTVATEIFEDSGCPHTLEHLVFMGSEKYPYKGIIDHFANRGFSTGTNAWTDTDHTAYTVSTAGEQGFMQLLPIYVDHILYPTMTDAGFVTEVHHIDPEGKDAGVVYSEMQGRENTAGDLMSLSLSRQFFPKGSAYRSETGGLMEAIRVLNVEKIREYHATYYVPHNLSLIVAGKLSNGTASLLDVVQKEIEPTLIAHGQNQGPRPPGWKRPFVETPSAERPPISKTIKKVVTFPEQDESLGELIISFNGPAPNAFLERQAIDVLATYLTSSTVAPLNKEFVETESPLCTYIYFSEEVRATRVALPIYVGSVPTEELDGFNNKLKTSFQRIVKEGIDMKRMSMVIDRDERQFRSKLESSKDGPFAPSLISDFLYGAEDGSEIHGALNDINQYAELRTWSSKQWTDLLARYFIDAESVVIIGKPSASMTERLKKDEKKRTAAQVERLGEEGLAKAKKVLEDAKAKHDAPIPNDVLAKFPIPSVQSISWIPVQSLQQPGTGRNVSLPQAVDTQLKQHIETDGKDLPFFVQYDNVQSDFVSVRAFLSLANLPDRLRPHLSVYQAAFFSLPVKRGSGEHLSHEEVVNKLDNETVSYEVSLGLGGSFSDLLCVSIKVEVDAYEAAVAWLKDLIYGIQFDKERMQVNVAKIQQSLPEMKRSGDNVLSSVWTDLLFSDASTSKAGEVIPQIEFIPKLAQELQESPDKVVADFEEIRKYMTEPSGLRFAVTGNVMKVKEPRSVWQKYFQHLPESTLSRVPLAVDTLSAVGQKPMEKAIVMTLPTIESSYVTHTTKGPQGYKHPDYPALRVALEVLNATESYLWRYIRGSGLAYGASVSADLEAGHLSFSLYRSANPIAAYKQASTVLKGLVDGSVALDETVLEAAKSSIVYTVTNNVSSASRAALASFANQALKGVPQNHQVELLDKFQAVTKEDVLEALKTQFLPLFDPSSSIVVAVTSPAIADEVDKGLTEAGFAVERRTLEVDPSEMEDSDSDDESSGSESDR